MIAKVPQDRLIDILKARDVEAADAGLHLAEAGDKLRPLRKIA